MSVDMIAGSWRKVQTSHSIRRKCLPEYVEHIVTSSIKMLKHAVVVRNPSTTGSRGLANELGKAYYGHHCIVNSFKKLPR